MRSVWAQAADPHEIHWGDLMEIGKPVSQPYDSTIIKASAMQAAVEALTLDSLTFADQVDDTPTILLVSDTSLFVGA